jgi:hypothetical protein
MYNVFMTKKNQEVSTNELFDYMQQGFASMIDKFEKVDERFEKVDERFDKVDKRFDRLEKFVVKGFDRTDKALETKASAEDMRRVINILDRIEKQQEISEDERQVMAFQLTRLHDWVEKAAKRLDIEFIK